MNFPKLAKIAVIKVPTGHPMQPMALQLKGPPEGDPKY
ncbi:chaperonin GroEL [Rhodobacterales bacterium HTCC2150]|nr:chaperonin GroEL [Rhodobacterales bacterium HTCC2150] [Rhodobacteraceae bacterium HTCC2150]